MTFVDILNFNAMGISKFRDFHNNTSKTVHMKKYKFMKRGGCTKYSLYSDQLHRVDTWKEFLACWRCIDA